MKIDSIQNGIVLDHITAGNAMKLYYDLGLDKLDCSVAMMQNVKSEKMGKKDIIKVDKDGVTIEKKKVALPKKLINIQKCKNPRCITAIEPNIPHIFNLTDPEKRIYRCIYCEDKARS